VLDCSLGSLIQAAKLSFWVEHNLFALQASLVYQIIPIFDGDITKRANDERGFQLLDSWTLSFLERYFEAEQKIHCKASHQEWILLQSIRRIIMVPMLLRSLYSALKDGTPLPTSKTSKLRETSELDWWTGINVSNSTMVTYDDFVQPWNNGQTQVVEDSKTILLKAYCHARGTFQLNA